MGCCVPPSKVSGASLILVRISYTKMDMSSVPMKPRNLSTNELLDRIATISGITGTPHSRRKAAKYQVELEGKGISVQVLYAFWWVRRNPQTSGQPGQQAVAAQPPATAAQPTGETSIKCWMGGIISVFTSLLYMTLLFEMDHKENWGHEGPNKDIKAEEADGTFVNHCWWAVVFFLLLANSCFLWRHPKKLWNAFGAVVLILMIHLTMIYNHWSNDHISNEQGFMWSVPLAVVNGGFFLVVWCFN